MPRIILSIILGIFVPIGYGILVSFGEGYLSESWVETRFYDQAAPGILLAPIALPIYFDIFTKEEKILPFIFDTFWFRASSFILFNWFLYGTITYFALGCFKWFRRRELLVSESPPLPPDF